MKTELRLVSKLLATCVFYLKSERRFVSTACTIYFMFWFRNKRDDDEVSFSETTVMIKKTTQRHTLADTNLHRHRRQIFKSHNARYFPIMLSFSCFV
jgi:hypothetical protein